MAWWYKWHGGISGIVAWWYKWHGGILIPLECLGVFSVALTILPITCIMAPLVTNEVTSMTQPKHQVNYSLTLAESLMNHINTSERMKGADQASADRFTLGYLVSMIAGFIESEPLIADKVENRIKTLQLRMIEDNIKGLHNVQ